MSEKIPNPIIRDNTPLGCTITSNGWWLQPTAVPNHIALPALHGMFEFFINETNLTDDQKMTLITKCPNAFAWIKHPTIEMRKTLLTICPEGIGYIDNPTEEEQLIVGLAHINMIKDPCEKLQLEAVKHSADAIYNFEYTYQSVVDLHRMMWQL